MRPGSCGYIKLRQRFGHGRLVVVVFQLMSYHQDRDCVAIVYFKFPGERLESVLYWQSWRL